MVDCKMLSKNFRTHTLTQWKGLRPGMDIVLSLAGRDETISVLKNTKGKPQDKTKAENVVETPPFAFLLLST